MMPTFILPLLSTIHSRQLGNVYIYIYVVLLLKQNLFIIGTMERILFWVKEILSSFIIATSKVHLFMTVTPTLVLLTNMFTTSMNGLLKHVLDMPADYVLTKVYVSE